MLTDVAISIYGKPNQSAITLLSLLKYSSRWIDTIYVIIESQQPNGTDFSLFYDLLKPYKVVYYYPKFHIGYFDLTNNMRRYLLPFSSFRYSIRYQYAWEKTNKKYIFITHNDMLYKSDIIGVYLSNIGDAIGIGKVGQCWNCPANTAELCNGDSYWNYRPSYQEITELYTKHGYIRVGKPFNEVISVRKPWPLPECRLNEFAVLINMEIAKPITMPKGLIYPLGVWGPVDTGTSWFRSISQRGYRVVNYNFAPFATHAWAIGTGGGGHQAMLDRTAYASQEEQAYDLLCREYNIIDK